MRTYIFLSLLCVSLVACGTKTPAVNPDMNHTHADFAVWIDGKMLDFSGPEFMSEELTPAEEEELKHQTGKVVKTDVASLQKYLHLHDGNGHVIHRHKPGLTLKDFFTTIKVDIQGNCYTSFEPMADGQQCYDHPFRMFVNGIEKTPFDLAYAFMDTDHILITNASDTAEVSLELSKMTDDACMYSKTCPERGEPPTENCIADASVPCTQ